MNYATSYRNFLIAFGTVVGCQKLGDVRLTPAHKRALLPLRALENGMEMKVIMKRNLSIDYRNFPIAFGHCWTTLVLQLSRKLAAQHQIISQSPRDTRVRILKMKTHKVTVLGDGRNR